MAILSASMVKTKNDIDSSDGRDTLFRNVGMYPMLSASETSTTAPVGSLVTVQSATATHDEPSAIQSYTGNTNRYIAPRNERMKITKQNRPIRPVDHDPAPPFSVTCAMNTIAPINPQMNYVKGCGVFRFASVSRRYGMTAMTAITTLMPPSTSFKGTENIMNVCNTWVMTDMLRSSGHKSPVNRQMFFTNCPRLRLRIPHRKILHHQNQNYRLPQAVRSSASRSSRNCSMPTTGRAS